MQAMTTATPPHKYKDDGRVSSQPPAVLLDGEEECEVQQVLAHRDRSRGKQNKRQLEYFVSWKGMGPEHSEWLRDSELTNAAELVQDYLDTLEPKDWVAACVGRPTQPATSESQVIPSGTALLRCAPREADLASTVQVVMLLSKTLNCIS